MADSKCGWDRALLLGCSETHFDPESAQRVSWDSRGSGGVHGVHGRELSSTSPVFSVPGQSGTGNFWRGSGAKRLGRPHRPEVRGRTGIGRPSWLIPVAASCIRVVHHPSPMQRNARTLNENDAQSQPSLALDTETPKMAPATKQRRAPSSARPRAESDSDAEYQAYNSRLKEASAARTRLRKVPSPPPKDTNGSS